MRNFIRFVIIFAIILFSAPVVQAVTFKVVVIPADLFKVCENYYCFPEMSEIISNDIIGYFNSSDKVVSPTIYDLRLKLAQNSNAKSSVKSSLDKFNARGNVDFQSMRQLAKLFEANSVLIVSSNVATEESSMKRTIWEILELSSNLNISYPYTMQTDAVLLDTVNDLVMWRGTYSKKLNSTDGSFTAENASESYAKYGYMQAYSHDILAKTIAQNVILRFFPKTVNPILNNTDLKPSGGFLRYESTSSSVNRHDEKKAKPLEQDYGEMIYGI